MPVRICSFIIIALFTGSAKSDFESASSDYRNRNYASAFSEFSKLAENGDPRAQTVLAIMYKYGESVPIDLTTAFNWYLSAARQGYPPAQFNAGLMLLEGSGVDRDEEQATHWLTRASESGYERATDKLAELQGNQLVIYDQEPIAWSKNWNLRLPNQIREEIPVLVPSALQVFRVQVGAMSTLAGAERLWQQLYVNNEELFADHQPIFREGNAAGKPVVRVQLGPFDLKPEADAFCQRYQQHFTRNAGCVVLRTN